MRKIFVVLVVAVLLLSGTLAGCKKQDGLDLAELKQYLQNNYDKFKIDGSTSMIPLHQSLNDLFSSNRGEAEHSKTVEAFEKFISGENDILLGVDYSDQLLDKAKENGIVLVKKEITREGFVFLINRNNPVKSLTVDQIKDIYSGKITNWKEVGGDDAPIIAFQRNDDSGSQIQMTKLMGSTKLMDKTYVAESMGELVLLIAGFDTFYDDTKYAIGYNMYTFTEKQYYNEEVMLLSVDGVAPTDDTIFDETYPIVIYNYIYYNKNNTPASEFAEKLDAYLMSDEGQKLISDSGYVNLNAEYDRNREIDLPYDDDFWGSSLNFYNKEKNEFYDVDENGKLLVYHSYPDFVLRYYPQYKNNHNARDFVNILFNSGIISSGVYVSEYNLRDAISVEGIWFDASFDQEDFFHIRYNGLYYENLLYLIDENKFVLLACTGRDVLNDYTAAGYLDGFPVDAVALENVVITRDDLRNVYLSEPGGYGGVESLDRIAYLRLVV